MFLPTVNKLREITIMWQNLLTEEQIFPLIKAMDLDSSVKREGHIYACDVGFSFLDYNHSRLLLTLVLYPPQTEHCSLCRKGTPNFRLLFLITIRSSTYLLKCFNYWVGAEPTLSAASNSGVLSTGRLAGTESREGPQRQLVGWSISSIWKGIESWGLSLRTQGSRETLLRLSSMYRGPLRWGQTF